MSAKKKPKKTRRDKSRDRLLINRRMRDQYQKIATAWARCATPTLRHIGGEIDGDWTFGAQVPAGKREAIADYATHVPLRWFITAVAVYRNDRGEERTYQVEAECGQAQKVHELHDVREELMRQCRQGNPNHAWDEYFLMRVL